MTEIDSSTIQYQTASEQLADTEEPPLVCSKKTRLFKNKFYSNVSQKDWDNWRWQIRNSITSYEELVRIFGSSEYELSEDINLPLRITPYYASTITSLNSGIGKCVIPTKNELIVTENELNDSLNEENQSPVECIVHRYPDRVLFLVTDFCSSNCRYCTRSRLVSHKNISKDMWEKGFEYIENHKEIHDCIISGGDPLLLSDDNIEYLLKRLRAIKHLDIIRMGSKVPCVLPMRITDELVNIIKKYHPVFMSLHFTHTDELTPEVKEAVTKLVDSGIPLFSQTVLLKDVNDNIDTMKELMYGLLKMRVKPYYLYIADHVVGTRHFRTSINKGLEIISGLRGYIGGYCQPTLIVDSEYGKIPLLPEYLVERDDKKITFKNYQGKEFVYFED